MALHSRKTCEHPVQASRVFSPQKSGAHFQFSFQSNLFDRLAAHLIFHSLLQGSSSSSAAGAAVVIPRRLFAEGGGGRSLLTSHHLEVAADYAAHGVRESGVLFHVVEFPRRGALDVTVWERDEDNIFTLLDLNTDKGRDSLDAHIYC